MQPDLEKVPHSLPRYDVSLVFAVDLQSYFRILEYLQFLGW